MKTSRRLLSVIGSTATHTMIGSIFYYYNFFDYRYSYLKRLDLSLQRSHFDLLIPSALMLMYSAFWLGAFIEKKTSPPLTVFIGSLFVLFATGFLWFSTSFALDYLLFGLYGIGIGINYLSSLKVLFFTFPIEYQHGIVIGTAMSGFGLASALCVMVTLLMNLHIIVPHINLAGDGDFIYPLYICKRLHLFQWIYFSALSGIAFLSVLCSFRYDEEKNYIISDSPGISTGNEQSTPLMKTDIFSETTEPKTVLIGYCSTIKPFSFLAIAFLSNVMPFLCIFTHVAYGYQSSVDHLIRMMCSIGFVLLSGIGRLLAGLVFSRFQFKRLMMSLLSLQLVSGVCLYFSVEWSWGFFIMISLQGFAYGGISIIFLLYISKIFYYDMGIEVYGFISIGTAASSISSIALLKLLTHAIGNYHTLHLCLYVIGSICSVLSGIIVMCIKRSKLDLTIN